jgi:hypothetical protein
MKKITATALARNLSAILDRLAIEDEPLAIERNHREVARLVPGPAHLTALEAMAGLSRTLPGKAAADWERDSRSGGILLGRVTKGVLNPWDF